MKPKYRFIRRTTVEELGESYMWQVEGTSLIVFIPVARFWSKPPSDRAVR
jgi:hypothetical protein